MMALFWVLMATLAFLALVVLVVVATPVHFIVTATTTPSFRFVVAVRLLGGIAPPLRMHDGAKSGEANRGKRVGGKKRAPQQSESASLSSGGIRSRRILAPLLRLVADFIGAVRFERLEVDADIGLEDPADTGQLYGYLTTLSHSALNAPRCWVDLRPDFSGPRLDGRLEAEAKFLPLALVPSAWRLALAIIGSKR